MAVFFLLLAFGFQFLNAAYVALIINAIMASVVAGLSLYFVLHKSWFHIIIFVLSLLDLYFTSMIWTFLVEKEQLPTLGFFGFLELITSQIIIRLTTNQGKSRV